jgi:hypothetical protein
MADGEDIQPLVCDNGTGMVKVSPLALTCTTFISKYATNYVCPLGWFCWGRCTKGGFP